MANDLRKSFCNVFLKDISSIENTLYSQNLKETLYELENYLDQFNCLKNSKLLIELNVKEKTIFKINSLINQKISIISSIL